MQALDRGTENLTEQRNREKQEFLFTKWNVLLLLLEVLNLSPWYLQREKREQMPENIRIPTETKKLCLYFQESIKEDCDLACLKT